MRLEDVVRGPCSNATMPEDDLKSKKNRQPPGTLVHSIIGDH